MIEFRQGNEITKTDMTYLFVRMFQDINSVDVSQLGDMSTGQFIYTIITDPATSMAEPFNRSSDQYADTRINPHTETDSEEISVLQKYEDEITKLGRRV